jgi:hypothetical protein
MEGEQTTPLNQLPNNSENDSDLVNKILDQLDEGVPAETVPPTFEDAAPVPVPQMMPTPQQNTLSPTLSNETMPSPQGIQNMISSLDTDRIYSAGKMAIFIAVMFLLFLTFGDNFVRLFSKLPFPTTDLTGSLNGTGKFLQAVCFGILYFLSNMFLLRA